MEFDAGMALAAAYAGAGMAAEALSTYQELVDDRRYPDVSAIRRAAALHYTWQHRCVLMWGCRHHTIHGSAQSTPPNPSDDRTVSCPKGVDDASQAGRLHVNMGSALTGWAACRRRMTHPICTSASMTFFALLSVR